MRCACAAQESSGAPYEERHDCAHHIAGYSSLPKLPGWSIGAILTNLAEQNKPPPGLYEMKIENPSARFDSSNAEPALLNVRFEERQVEQIQFPYPEQSFEKTQRLSEWNERFCSTWISPWIRSSSNPLTAEAIKWRHPMRASRIAFSEQANPWMVPVRFMAPFAQQSCHPVDQTNLYVRMDRRASGAISDWLDAYRKARDAVSELIVCNDVRHAKR